LMPGFILSCLAMLGLMPDRKSASFRLSLAGTAGFVAMLGMTALEIPFNKRTLAVSPDDPPADWHAMRADWQRYNALRTGCEVAGWCCLLKNEEKKQWRASRDCPPQSCCSQPA